MLKKRVGKKRTWVTQEAELLAIPGERLAVAHRNALKSLPSSAGSSSNQLQSPTQQRYRWCLNEACVCSSVVPVPDSAVAELAHLVAHHPSQYVPGPHPSPHLSEEEAAAGVKRATLLVAAAWREERRDPAVAICLAAEAVEAAGLAEPQSNGDDEPEHAVRRSSFIFGKLLIEAFVQFDLGAMLLEHALGTTASALPLTAAEQRRRRDEEVGIAFHLSRALYDNYRYDECWNVLVSRTQQHFPDAWTDSPSGAAQLKSAPLLLNRPSSGTDLETTTTIITPTPTAPALAPAPAPAPAPALPAPAPAPAPALVSKYHRAMLLHGCVLAAVFRPAAASAVSSCIAAWIDAHRDVMWRQFNAEIRFATVIQRLLPMEPPVVAGDLANTEPIYALGESHTLPLIWQTLDLGGTLGSRQVLPRLVIGLKAWHFNPELVHCRERGILLSHASSIPPKSTIIVCAGEIDLREAGAIAMLPQYWGEHRPKKYASPEKAIAATVEAFFAGLRTLRDLGDHRHLLVHPVRPPPRDYHAAECHGLTVQWNEAVAAAAADPVNARIALLDFFDSLCDDPPDPPAPTVVATPVPAQAPASVMPVAPLPVLRPDFHIGDGFHLNRKYLPLVASSVSRSLLA